MLRAPPRPPERGLVSEARPVRVGAKRTLGRLPRRGLLVGAGVAALVLVVVSLAFGPVVRSRVAKEGARRRMDITVGSVRPGFFAVHLRDVRVRLDGVTGVETRLDAVEVDLTAGLSVGELVAHGGEVKVEGEPADVAERLRTWRTVGAEKEHASSSRARTPFRIDGVALSWRLPSGGELTGAGLFARRDTTTTRLGCAQCKASRDHVGVDVTDAEVELGADSALMRISAATVLVTYEPPRADKREAPSVQASAEPAPPPLPTLVRGKAPKKGRAAALPVHAPSPERDEPVLPLPDLHALRNRIHTAARNAGTRIPDGTEVDIAGLSAKLDVGGEPVAFGPGRLTLHRAGDRIRLAFASEKADAPQAGQPGGTPLSLDADVPIGDGDVTARLSGGPVSLALLGVKEGTKGLFDVAHGTVAGKGQLVLASGGEALTFDGNVALRTLSIKQPRLAPGPLRGLDFSVSARGVVDDAGKLRVDDAQLDMGALHVKTRGTMEETKDHFGLSLDVDVAPAACQALLESAPQGLLPTIRAARMAGTFGAGVHVAFDTRTIDKMLLDYQIDDRCRLVEVSRELSRDRFTGPFAYRTYHPDGSSFETTTGPRSTNWTDLDDISPYMVAAVLTTEDGAFYKHKGFNHAAIRQSVQANLKARRFVRGASTITMQLAKNLFLARDKHLSRKIEEVVLTDYLEQIFRKDDMMELYLNVVEFGPDVYGITQAAEHYFGRRPEELNLAESFFLASLLPSPVRYGKLRDKGEVTEGWLRHLRALMEYAGKYNRVTPAELAEGLAQEVKFVKPGDPRPEPRKPYTRTRREATDDDVGWQPLE